MAGIIFSAFCLYLVQVDECMCVCVYVREGGLYERVCVCVCVRVCMYRMMVGIILSAFCPYLVHVDDCVCERERGGNAPQYTATHTTTHCNTEVCVCRVMVEII